MFICCNSLRSAVLPIGAMVSFLCASFAVASCAIVVTALRDDTSQSDNYSYVFEILLTMTMIFLASTCWLLSGALRGSKCFTETGVQCELGISEPVTGHFPPGGAIYFAPSSVCWHRDRGCKHLKSSGTNVSNLTPCKTCGAHGL